jgi:hypothetical protein
MSRLLALVALLLVGCQSADECTSACAPRMIQSFNWWSQQCSCSESVRPPSPPEAPQISEAVRNSNAYCDACAKRCAPHAIRTCKFANSTWGAGPDVCECAP